ncbi:MAG: hypothetical protein HY906_03315 [Deltaproteobacteria bacterium]|nr:hypothetical protein [Deltaproteobacteria bacterium]
MTASTDQPARAPEPPSPSAWRRRAEAGLPPAGFVAVALALQLWTPVPFDADTAYHLAVARLIREHGVLQSFPWTPFSWLADHYADKELLFHLLLVPLAGLDWTHAARIAGVACGAAALLGPWAVLRAERVPRAWLWALLPMLASGYFAMRLALVRPHLLAIPLAAVATWAASRRRHRWLFAAAAVYPFAYVGWIAALVLAVLAEGAALLSGRRPSWRTPAVALGGLAAGVLLHPNRVELLRFAWLVVSDILVGTAWAGKTGFTLGGEFQPMVGEAFLRFGSLPWALTAVAAAVAWQRRREDAQPLTFALAAAAWGGASLGTERFVEYFAPFSALALALALGARPRRWLAPGLAAGALAFTAAFGLGPVRALRLRALDFPPPLEAALRERVPVGAQVFTCGWLTTGEMMLALPGRRFMVALDPVLFHRKDPALYARWYELVHRPPPLPALAVRETFGAGFVLCETQLREMRPVVEAMARDPGAKVEVESRYWVLFSVAGGAPPR